MNLTLNLGCFDPQRWLPVMPTLLPEECVTFRVLVQVMVAIGIVLTDLAGGTAFSLWAIGVSAIGAAFSWHRRHEHNIAVKFLLALATRCLPPSAQDIQGSARNPLGK